MNSADYKSVLLNLYQKIKPTGGTIGHRISPAIVETGSIDSLWVEFELPNFKYHDPFYGEIEAKNNFKMFFETTCSDRLINIRNIAGLRGKVYEFSINQLTGSFSNSLDFNVIKCAFGDLVDGGIDIGMDYFLTNSDSYGNMRGSIEEHSNFRGHISTRLTIADMIFEDSRKDKQGSLENYIDGSIYDFAKIYPVGKSYGQPWFEFYKVPLKN